MKTRRCVDRRSGRSSTTHVARSGVRAPQVSASSVAQAAANPPSADACCARTSPNGRGRHGADGAGHARGVGGSLRRGLVLRSLAFGLATAGVLLVWVSPVAHADNKRLNDSVVMNVYTIQHQAGCTNDVRKNPQLQLAAQWHAEDVLDNRSLAADIGSDGTTAQQRADAAGFRGTVAETVAINPALAISGIELLHQWFDNPAYLAIMRDCANTAMGVWSVNSLDRTVVVAVYGRPA